MELPMKLTPKPSAALFLQANYAVWDSKSIAGW